MSKFIILDNLSRFKRKCDEFYVRNDSLDDTPTFDSERPVKSGGVKIYVDESIENANAENQEYANEAIRDSITGLDTYVNETVAAAAEDTKAYVDEKIGEVEAGMVTNAVTYDVQETTQEQQEVARRNIQAHGRIYKAYPTHADITEQGEEPELTIRVDHAFGPAFTSNTHIEVFPVDAETEAWLQENLISTIVEVIPEYNSFTFKTKTGLPTYFAIYYTISEVEE